MKLNLLPEMLLLSIFLYLKVENNQQIKMEPSFGTSHGVLTFLLTHGLRMTFFIVFSDYFSLDNFCALYIIFQLVRLVH